ncbi:carbamoylphosphate synthase large subunit [Paenibacillus athensensis]|uniref:ATP-grasp domain-containing protein n=1 Tax=Paenibacillus athensensis TaxID=1967502 RepID=A0A4Y8Q3W2_9BACL|nr:carbamoylphosphate synthase large subunit [Paenibacillus athensensis]MCD1258472.1 carbamoylphosphate synthase large subunit [Paenibacillus athensensis]
MRTDGPGVLLTGGRAPAALELARALAEGGWRVHAAESLSRHLCRASRAVAGSHRVPAPAEDPGRYAAALAELATREGLGALVPACEEVFHIARYAQQLAASGCRVLAAPLTALARLHSKWAFIRLAASYGFDVPHTRLLTSPAAWREAVEQTDERLVLKPVYSRFAANVTFVGAMPGIPAKRGAVGVSPADHLIPPVSERYPWVAQQYVAGRELCAYAIAHEGRLAAFAVYESFYRAGRGATVYFEALPHAALREWVGRFVALERFSGQIAFDFIETPEGRLYPLECNPRATSGVHLFRGDGARLAAALLAPERLDGVCLQPRAGAKAMLTLPMLACGLAAQPTPRGALRWLGKLLTARDAVFRWRDPLPYAGQLGLLGELARIGRKRGVSLMAASTLDMEWNGDA